MREVAIYSSRSVNQPLGLYHVLVCVGEGGILKNVAIPMDKVINPLLEMSDKLFEQNGITYSIKNSHLVGYTPR